MTATSLGRGAVAAVLLVVAGASAPPATASVPPSSTALILSAVESPFGQRVTATATVSANPGPAQGDVVFTVEGTSIKANLGASGVTSLVLPGALVGQHTISAAFVPQFPDRQEGSVSPTQTWVVTQVRTRVQVRVIGRGTRIPTSVEVSAAGDFGSRPTGRVVMVVRRVGSPGRTRVVERLDITAVAVARLGKLAKGTYRLVVNYRGDPQHLSERQSRTFYVQRR